MPTLRVNLPPELSQDIARLVESGRYESIDEVVFVAVQQLAAVEEGKALLEPAVPVRLTANVEWSDDQCCVYCPELDLVTAMDTEDEALTDLAEMAVEYAEDYLDDFAFYAGSPDRGRHLPYVLAVARRTTDAYDDEGVRQVRELFDIRHEANA